MSANKCCFLGQLTATGSFEVVVLLPQEDGHSRESLSIVTSYISLLDTWFYSPGYGGQSIFSDLSIFFFPSPHQPQKIVCDLVFSFSFILPLYLSPLW